MKTLAGFVLLLPIASAPAALADSTYALSPDGSAVVRLVPQGTVGASTLSSTALPGGYAVTAGSGASPVVTSYTAGFQGGAGGAQFTSLYSNGTALGSNQSLNWVQVITTNAPLGGASSPYLDNALNPSTPFYSYSAQNRDPSLPPNQINFYDYSKRNPSALSTTNPVTWNASLYPVVTTSGSTSIEAENGVTWGWTMKKAPVGSTSASFVSPIGGIDTGVGTNAFSWGTGDPSSLSFLGTNFDTQPNTPFSLGRLTFRNGTIDSGTGADGITLDLKLSFENVPEKNFEINAPLGLVNTPNTNDPAASADLVVVNGYGYTFNVLEGASASVDLIGELSTGLSLSPNGVNVDGLFSPVTFDLSPDYRLTLLGFAAPSEGGFVTGPNSVPEPSSTLLCLTALAFAVRRPRCPKFLR